jgi:hypothetical protein
MNFDNCTTELVLIEKTYFKRNNIIPYPECGYHARCYGDGSCCAGCAEYAEWTFQVNPGDRNMYCTKCCPKYKRK